MINAQAKTKCDDIFSFLVLKMRQYCLIKLTSF